LATAESLRRLSRADALALFAGLPAPAPPSGEYTGHIPAYIEPAWRAFLAEARIGHWLGKGYAEGQGYNIYQAASGIVRRLRFAWSFGVSSLDGRPALLMHYAAFPNWAGRQDLTDELREVAPGLLLGIYYTRDVVAGFTPRPGNGRTEPELFILSGPVAEAHPPDRD
jgi:hypothetical protein